MDELTAPWILLARRAGLPDPVINWSLSGDPLPPVSSQTFRSSAGEATLTRASLGWEVRYDDAVACRIEHRELLTISLDGHHPGSHHHATRLAGPITALVMSACGYYPLHAVGILIGSRLFAVYAGSGRGKSTLAACAARHGESISGDDLLAVSPTGIVEGLPGALRIQPGLAPEGWAPTRILPDGRGWYRLRPIESLPLSGLLLLGRGDDVELIPEKGANRLVAVMRAGFLSHLVADPPPHWHVVIDRLTSTVPVWRLQVPDGLDRLDASWPELRHALEQRGCP